MNISLLKSKLLRAEITDRALHYEGSLAIDSALMEAVGLLPYEKILVANIANGERFETYALSLIHISEPTRRTPISYAVFCLKKKKRPSSLKTF